MFSGNRHLLRQLLHPAGRQTEDEATWSRMQRWFMPATKRSADGAVGPNDRDADDSPTHDNCISGEAQYPRSIPVWPGSADAAGYVGTAPPPQFTVSHDRSGERGRRRWRHGGPRAARLGGSCGTLQGKRAKRYNGQQAARDGRPPGRGGVSGTVVCDPSSTEGASRGRSDGCSPRSRRSTGGNSACRASICTGCRQGRHRRGRGRRARRSHPHGGAPATVGLHQGLTTISGGFLCRIQ